MSDSVEVPADDDGGAARRLGDRLKKLREYLGMSQQYDWAAVLWCSVCSGEALQRFGYAAHADRLQRREYIDIVVASYTAVAVCLVGHHHRHAVSDCPG